MTKKGKQLLELRTNYVTVQSDLSSGDKVSYKRLLEAFEYLEGSVSHLVHDRERVLRLWRNEQRRSKRLQALLHHDLPADENKKTPAP